MRLMALLALPLLWMGCDGKDGGDDSGVTDDQDQDGWTVVEGDCDDTDAAINPGTAEVYYDGLDNDCDAATVDDDQDADGYAVGEDCADTDAAVNPGAVEECDGIDNDCSGVIDDNEAGGTVGYQDKDEDGYGDAGVQVNYCGEMPPGVADNADDCDDYDNDVYPGAPEVCDADDNDCDTLVDEDPVDGDTYYVDTDQDGYGDSDATVIACGVEPGIAAVGGDCDDTVDTVNPDADETCNEVDDDCDGEADEDAVDAPVWYYDNDGDGQGNPDASVPSCDQPGGTVDNGDDCDDANTTIYLGAPEQCDGIDNDCDGTVDDDVTTYPWYTDGDGDGYGNDPSVVYACLQPSGTVALGGDCNDVDPAVSPGAAELCNGADDDCDYEIDEVGAVDGATWYLDADDDGYGVPDATVTACSDPDGYAATDDDCDDGDASVYPGSGTDAADLVDADCDGWVDEDDIAFGSLVITEIARQPRFGATSTENSGMWFEVHNMEVFDIAMSNFYIVRYTTASDVDAFFVDPADAVIVPAGGYAVFCKTDDYEFSSGVGYPLACDYIWGDETQPSSYEGYFHDNTFNFKRDEDNFGLYIEGGTSAGRVIDDITWTYDATDGYWPRVASRSMGLDPYAMGATSNDDEAYWCSTDNSTTTYTWWTDGTSYEYGTPGATNYDCP